MTKTPNILKIKIGITYFNGLQRNTQKRGSIFGILIIDEA